MGIPLRPYQQDALDALETSEDDGITRPMLAWATGLGKTIAFANWLKEREGRSLVLAHRDELIRQAVERIEMVAPHLSIGVVKAEENEVDKKIIVASVQSLHPKRLAQLKKIRSIVVDEAHHAEADSYKRILTELGTFDGVPTLGVTATPMRADGRGLGNTFEQIVHHMTIRDGIKQGYLCNLRAFKVQTKADFGSLKVRQGEVDQGEAGEELMSAEAPRAIAAAIKQYAADRPTLVFCPTIEVSDAVTAAVQATGREAMHVDGTTERDIRRAAVRNLKRGWVLTNCGVYTEGFDCPEIACIVIARPTKSEGLYIQMVGRGTRLAPDKEDCIILDIVGATMRHDLCTAKVLQVGVSDEEQAAEEREAEIRHRYESDAEEEYDPREHRVVAHEVDLWSARPFAWIKVRTGFVLDVSGGRLRIMPDGEQWCVMEETRESRSKLWKGPDLGYAQGWAEDEVKRRGEAVLARKDAAWRSDPMTPGQKYMMDRWRVRFNEDWTKGQASEAITKAIANATRR